MKIRISYFYQIRNFKPNMIPMSTALSDPAWYHDFKGPDYIFTDKRGVLNGLRLKPIIVQGGGSCPCDAKDPTNCPLAADYEFNLSLVNFDEMIKGIFAFAENYKKDNKIKEEIIMVLIVYEAPNNPCSERYTLIKYFNEHGIDCRELEYPIT